MPRDATTLIRMPDCTLVDLVGVEGADVMVRDGKMTATPGTGAGGGYAIVLVPKG